MSKRLFTSESVTEGHPDKICDQISDAVLDAILAEDPQARVACESFATTGIITVMGEITTSTYVDISSIVRKTVLEIGYDAPEKSFNGRTCAVMTAIDEQSPDIAMGVNDALEHKEGIKSERLGLCPHQAMHILRKIACGVSRQILFIDMRKGRNKQVDSRSEMGLHVQDVLQHTWVKKEVYIKSSQLPTYAGIYLFYSLLA